MTALEDIRATLEREYVGRKIKNTGTGHIVTITGVCYTPLGFHINADDGNVHLSLHTSNLGEYKFI